MPKTIIAEGKTTQDAIEKGLRELGASKNQVEIKAIEEKKKSFFNILDPHIVKVQITLKDDEKNFKREEKIAKKDGFKKEVVVDKALIEKAKRNIQDFLQAFLPKLSNKIEYNISIEDDTINVVIEGEDASSLIGYRGEALNSMQTIISNIANKQIEGKIRVILDIGNYKDLRKKTLEELAAKIEKTVLRTGKQVTLEPMTAYERKIIHTKLQDSKYVRTYSIGEDDRRRVVIAKK